MPDSGPSRPVIVVGVDGSDASKDALRWAARQAEQTGARLQVVMTWHIPPVAYQAGFPDGFNYADDTRRVLDETITEVLKGFPSLDLTSQIIEGHPAPVLLHAADGAELLVVGSRGHGAFTGMLLGSVSEHCVSHAPCPVVVVRHTTSPA